MPNQVDIEFKCISEDGHNCTYHRKGDKYFCGYRTGMGECNCHKARIDRLEFELKRHKGELRGRIPFERTEPIPPFPTAEIKNPFE